MSKFFSKIFLLNILIILSNIKTINSIKERVIWFGSNRTELNSSETMGYSSNSSSEQLSSNLLNQRIANDLDFIENKIKVNIQKNNKFDRKDSRYQLILEKQRPSADQNDENVENGADFEYKADDSLDFYVEKNLLNYHNFSDETISDFPNVGQNSSVILNKDILNHSFIDSDNIEIEKIFSDESKIVFNSNKTSVSMNEKSKNNSLIETTTTSPYLNDVPKVVVSQEDKDQNNSKSHGNGNIYKRKVIITVETSDSPPTTTSMTTQRSNSLIDRIKYLSEKEVNNKLAKNELPVQCGNNCDQFIKLIKQTVSGDSLTVRFESKPETCVEKLSLFLSCESLKNECKKEQNWESLCKTPQNCINNNISETEFKLQLNNNNINNNSEEKCITVYYKCANNRNGSNKEVTKCTIAVDFNQEKPESDNRVVVIIVATVVPIIICVAIFAFLYFKRNKNMKKFDCFGVKILKQMPYRSKSRKRRVDKMPTDASAGTAVIKMEEVSQQQHKVVPKSKSISFDEFSQYYQKTRADSGLKLAEEYEELKELTAKKRSMKISQFTINKAKNRFVNILPYDHSIVPLSLKNGVIGSDYINANFIDGFNCDKEYIASQGPLYSTVNDFFRMIIEHNIRITVCLTQCIEKGRSKCEKYWPNNDDIDEIDEQSSHSTVPNLSFDDITIELIDESHEKDFIVRELKIIKDGSHHWVTQYHFVRWPDFGCPQNPCSLINLIEIIRKKFQTISDTNSTECQQKFYSPILVHCSAGVGRSGTFIAVDKIMQMFDKRLKSDTNLTKDISIDIFGTVCDMRRNRPNMVQTEDQYIFIYDCIKYLIDRYEHKIIGETNEENEESNSNLKDNNGQQNSEQNNNELRSPSDEDLISGAHINRQFSLNESSENTEL